MEVNINLFVFDDQTQKMFWSQRNKKKMSLSVQHPRKDNIVMIIGKNTTPEEDKFYEYPYYIARIQRLFTNTKNDGLKHNTPIIDL